MSEKYKQRPSEVLGLDNTHLAFCFDEAVELILSHRYYKDVKKNGQTYREMRWTKTPRWIDEEMTNDDVVDILIKNLEHQKKIRGLK